jgi:dihydrofolate reductase
VQVVLAVEEAVALGRKLAAQRGATEAIVIGGAEIFRATLPVADRVYLTIVRGNPPGDTYLEAFDRRIWTETVREAMLQGPQDDYPADFVVLDRKR